MPESASALAAGRGPALTLVLLPGMDGTGELFQPLRDALGEDVTTIVVRYPSQGAQDYATLEACARRFLPAQGPYLLLGESFSGPVATAIAASSPPGLQGLILCCTFVRSPRPALAKLAPLAGLASIHWLPGPILGHVVMGRWRTPALQASLTAAMARTPASGLAARVRAVLTADASARLREVRVPVLYIRALRDQLVPGAAATHIKRVLPTARVVAVDAPHFLLQVVPEAAVAAIRAFMGRMPVSFDGIAPELDGR